MGSDVPSPGSTLFFKEAAATLWHRKGAVRVTLLGVEWRTGQWALDSRVSHHWVLSPQLPRPSQSPPAPWENRRAGSFSAVSSGGCTSRGHGDPVPPLFLCSLASWATHSCHDDLMKSPGAQVTEP